MRRLDHDSLVYYDASVVQMISEKYGWNSLEALRQFACSKTHLMLEDPDMGLTDFGPGGVFDMWEAERVTGDPRDSIYIRGEQ